MMVRTQIQLTEEQAAAVKRIAAQRGVSMAEVIREGVDAVVKSAGQPSKEEIRRRMLSVIGIVKGGPKDLATNHDKYLAEAYEN